NDALNTATNAMIALAHALGTGSKKSSIKIDFYYGNRTQNPVTWIKKFK
ncbi:38136_t:CDS:1, partial [Gigaspora margarita]